MARATRAVSSGMGEIACGCNDMGLLLLMSSFVLITLSFSYSTIILLLLLCPFANRVNVCTSLFFPPSTKENKLQGQKRTILTTKSLSENQNFVENELGSPY